MWNFLLLYWKFQFFLSTGDKHFLTKPENSKTPQGGGIQLPQISLLTLSSTWGWWRGKPYMG